MARQFLFTFAFIVIVHPIVTFAKEFIVGDETGWTSNYDYESWAKGKEFRVEDKLVNEVACKNCIIPQDGVLASGEDTITLDSPGPKYFVCGVGLHCESGGQKLIVNVKQEGKQVPTEEAMVPSQFPTANGLSHAAHSQSSTTNGSSHATHSQSSTANGSPHATPSQSSTTNGSSHAASSQSSATNGSPHTTPSESPTTNDSSHAAPPQSSIANELPNGAPSQSPTSSDSPNRFINSGYHVPLVVALTMVTLAAF